MQDIKNLIGLREVLYRLTSIVISLISMVSIVWSLPEIELLNYYTIIPFSTLVSMLTISPISTKIIQTYSNSGVSIYAIIIFLIYLALVSLLTVWTSFYFNIFSSYSRLSIILYIVADFLFGTLGASMLVFVSIKRGSALNSLFSLLFSLMIYLIPALYCAYTKSLESWLIVSAIGKLGFFLVMVFVLISIGYNYQKITEKLKVDENFFYLSRDFSLQFCHSILILILQNVMSWMISQGPKVLAIAMLNQKIALIFAIAFQSSTSVVSSFESIIKGLIENSYKHQASRVKVKIAYRYILIFAVPASALLFLVNIQFSNIEYIYYVFVISILEAIRIRLNYNIFIYQINKGIDYYSLFYSAMVILTYYVSLCLFLLIASMHL